MGFEFLLVGEPVFPRQLESSDERFPSPPTSAQFAVDLRRRVDRVETLQEALRFEYISILAALREMGPEFRIVYGHPEDVDKTTLGMALSLGCRLAGVGPDFFPGGTIYPRDLAMRAGKVNLINSGWTRLLRSSVELIASPFGEGGRTLATGNTILVGERIIEHEGKSRWVNPDDLAPLHAAGLQVGILPLPVAVFCTMEGVTDRVFFNDHWDRYACLVTGRDGGKHLILDPCVMTAAWVDVERKSWALVNPADSEKVIRTVCEPLGVTVHRLPGLEVPYALNLIQLADGRILMTGGDDIARGVLEELVGTNQVFTTEAPICHYPVFAQAGIRCLVSEAPPVFKRRV